MRPIVRRVLERLFLLAICGVLGACCGSSNDCEGSAECESTPADPATDITPVVDCAAVDAATGSPSAPKTSLPEGSRVSYPMFEGDYFTVKLPVVKPEETSRSYITILPRSSVIVCPVTAKHVSNHFGGLQIKVDHKLATDRAGNLGEIDEADLERILAFQEKMPAFVKKMVGDYESDDETNDSTSINSPQRLVKLKNDIELAQNTSRKSCAKEFVEDVIIEMGFSDTDGTSYVQAEFLDVEPHEMHRPGGDILEVASINCQTSAQTDPGSFCNLDKEQKRQLIRQATGMKPEDYLDRKLIRYYFFQRPQQREWPANPDTSEEFCAIDSTGKCKDAFIEHAAIAATTNPDGDITSVKGRIFANYKIANNPSLKRVEAIKMAYENLFKMPDISPHDHRPVEPDPALVLLPYGQTLMSELGGIRSTRQPSDKTPLLRYAYRTTLYGNFEDKSRRRHVEAASWRAWVDAETGDILQLVPLFAFSHVEPVAAKGKGWPRSPSFPLSNGGDPTNGYPTERYFNVDKANVESGEYCLKLAHVFDQVEFIGRVLEKDESGNITQVPKQQVFCSESEDFSDGWDCDDTPSPWDCLCQNAVDTKAIHYLAMNAYAHVYAYKKKLDEAICSSAFGAPPTPPPNCDGEIFQAAKNETEGPFVPLRIQIGGKGSQGWHIAEVNEPHLTFAETRDIFSYTNYKEKCWNGPNSNLEPRPAAQDATLMTHEFAHVIMQGLHAGQSKTWCGQLACPVPFSFEIFHDMADGLSAVSNVNNWFGAWWRNVDPTEADTYHSEGWSSPRKFDPFTDHFPEHRDWGSVELGYGDDIDADLRAYADGQIAAAALWAVTDSMNSWIDNYGPSEFETSLLNILFDHFVPSACQTFSQGEEDDYTDDCDLDIYRYLHFLLAGLIENDRASGTTVISNKVTAGFARAGIFLVPPQCIGAGLEPTVNPDHYCPTGAYGGDAVIDIDNNWLRYDQNTLIDVPRFEVWTGPEFRFDGDDAKVGEALAPDDPPCNSYYRITIANNPDFETKDTPSWISKDTGWLDTKGDCYERWIPPADWELFWNDMTQIARGEEPDPETGELVLNRVYYLVETSDCKDNNPMSSNSLCPGDPFCEESERIAPPFAVLIEAGLQEP